MEAYVDALLVAGNVCRELVLYDAPFSNPFRELIPLTQRHEFLLQIIVATSALHMSRASENFVATSSHSSNQETSQCLLRPNEFATSQRGCYDLALAAKQRALKLLNIALGSMELKDLDVILATVLLFVQFELIDTRQDEWKHHIRGARSLINIVYKSRRHVGETMSVLRRCLIANCLL